MMDNTQLYYRASLTDKKAIHVFIHELEDIARSLAWKVNILDEAWSIKPDAVLELSSIGSNQVYGNTALKGIALYPSTIDSPISLYFNASCVLTTPQRVAKSAAENYPVEYSWLCFDTREMDRNVEIAFLQLMTYLKEKYLHDLEMKDGYGKTIHYSFDDLSGNSLDIVDKLERALRELDR